MTQGGSYYKIKGDTLQFSDIRTDAVRHNISPLFKIVQLVETKDRILHKKLDDCKHKIQAVGYSLLLIQAEIINFQEIAISDLEKYSSMVGMCPKTEFINDVLIFELESFLFQTKSSLDILVQALKYLYPCLDEGKLKDIEEFKIMDHSNDPKDIRTKLNNANNYILSEYISSEYDSWIKEMKDMRNTITHRSGLEDFLCFYYFSEKSFLDKPKMPSGEYLDNYCNETYNKLLKFYEKIFQEYLMVEFTKKYGV